LVQEPFVSGADTWIDRVVADIPNADNGFTLIFSSTSFPGHQYRLDWRRAEAGGNWYYSADLDMEGWLSPALFRYFFRRASVPLRPDKGSDLVLFFILHPNGELLAASLQCRSAARLSGLQTSSTGGLRSRVRSVAGFATSTGSAGHAGVTTSSQLTFDLDHSMKAAQGT
jgi:hypothetical protein